MRIVALARGPWVSKHPQRAAVMPFACDSECLSEAADNAGFLVQRILKYVCILCFPLKEMSDSGYENRCLKSTGQKQDHSPNRTAVEIKPKHHWVCARRVTRHSCLILSTKWLELIRNQSHRTDNESRPQQT